MLFVLLDKLHSHCSHDLIHKSGLMIWYNFKKSHGETQFEQRESLFCSCDLFFFYWPEWRCMERVRACVCVFSLLLMGAPPSPLPAPQDPRKAEWHASGLAKWWNDDPIMRSDSKMRGIRQRLQPPLADSPSSRSTLPAAQMMIDSAEMDHRKHPLIFSFSVLSKNIYLQLYPQSISRLGPIFQVV